MVFRMLGLYTTGANKRGMMISDKKTRIVGLGVSDITPLTPDSGFEPVDWILSQSFVEVTISSPSPFLKKG